MPTAFRSLAKLLTAALAAPVFAQSITTRVSVDSAGVQAAGASSYPAISRDGRFVAFASSASNLVAGDTNNVVDVFVHDRTNGVTMRESFKPSGSQTTQHATQPALSADAQLLAFALINGPVFARDRVAATTRVVSIDHFGATHAGSSPAISPDGRWVAFASPQALEPLDTNARWDVYLHDLVTRRTRLVSVSATGGLGDDDSSYDGAPAVSTDARFVAFSSEATNLVPGDTNGWIDVFVRDRALATTERVSVDSLELEGLGYSLAPVLSDDGRHVAFQSSAPLVQGDLNGLYDVFVRDRVLGRTECVSVDPLGIQGALGGRGQSLSPDGRFVAFASDASSLVGAPLQSAAIILRDRALGTTVRVSPLTTSGHSYVFPGSLAADARTVAYQSEASDLVAGDTNSLVDVFVTDRGAQAPIAFCTAGTSANGCVPALTSTGTPSATFATPFQVHASSVDGQRNGLILYGLDNSGFAPLPWGTGSSYACVKPPAQRTDTRSSGGNSGACDGTLSLDWNSYLAMHPSALGAPFAAGQSVFAQAWFRDPPSAKTSSLSNALAFTVEP